MQSERFNEILKLLNSYYGIYSKPINRTEFSGAVYKAFSLYEAFFHANENVISKTNKQLSYAV